VGVQSNVSRMVLYMVVPFLWSFSLGVIRQ